MSSATINEIVSFLQDFINDLLSKLEDIFSGLGLGLFTSIYLPMKTTLGQIESGLRDHSGSLVDTLETFFRGIEKSLAHNSQVLQEAVNEAFEKIYDGFEGVKTWVIDSSEFIMSRLRGLDTHFSNMIDGLSRMILDHEDRVNNMIINYINARDLSIL